MIILGVRHGHDSSAAIVVDGQIVADVQEERFTRQKNDTSFPINAINYCLKTAGVSSRDIDILAIPNSVIQEQFFSFFDIPKKILPSKKINFKEKIKKTIIDPYSQDKNLPVLPLYQKKFKLSEKCRIECIDHHLSHAASAAYTSGLDREKALIVTMDGSGENVSNAIWRWENNKIEKLVSFDRTSSLGYFYSTATEAMMWRHGSDEWKVMGLAPYGKPQPGILKEFHPEFKDGKFVKGVDFGNFGRWNDHGANHYHSQLAAKMVPLVEKLGRENFAAEAQRVSEEQALNLILPWLEKEGVTKILCAGGFFLNVKLNKRLWYSDKLDFQWIYPNCGDSGLAVGSALYAYHKHKPEATIKKLDHLYKGPEFSDEEIKKILDDKLLDYEFSENPSKTAAQYLSRNLAVAWFQGRMETGPRALGHRSILMSPLRAENKDIINKKIKFREEFRPFTPSMIYEKHTDYIIKPRDEEYMVSSFEVKEEKKDKIPAVVHVDGTSRPNMVKKEINPGYHELIKNFGEITGEYVVLNTSFNIKGEPIVLHPREAIKCFYDTGLDVLVMGSYVLKKSHVKHLDNKNQDESRHKE